MELRGVETINEILDRLKSLESGSGGSAPTPNRSSQSVTSVSTDFTASPFERVKAVLETQRKMLLVTALDHALTTTLENGELFVEYAPDSRHFRDTLSKPENIKFVRDACREVTGQETGLRITVKNSQAEGAEIGRASCRERVEISVM